MSLPTIGTKAVHKDDHAKTTGPVWEVVAVKEKEAKPIHLDHAPDHKMNIGVQPASRQVTEKEFKEDYKEL